MTLLSTKSKKLIVASSNNIIRALCFVGVLLTWDQCAFQTFLNIKLGIIWPCLLAYLAFLTIMPLLSWFNITKDTKEASTPTVSQARIMALCTAAIDYFVVGTLFLFWNSICRLEDGSMCPFTAASSVVVALVVMPIKDELQCRFLWRDFISPYKLKSWPYSWKASLEQLCTSVMFGVLSLLALCLSRCVSFENILATKVVMQIWCETMTALLILDVVMHFVHTWMHEKAYFLHKKHHRGNANVTSFLFPQIDLLDAVSELGAAVPALLAFKKLLGLNPEVHLLTHQLLLLMGFQNHSGNPYSVHLFNPVLDFLGRSTLWHNLHHVVLADYYTFIPHSHFLRSENRRKDIDMYNKHMKTNFPRTV